MKIKRTLRTGLKMLCGLAAALAAVFVIGRYGWHLGGFNACQSAGIESVTVEDGQVEIQGFYPGSFPEGFIGCHARQEGDTLYVGFRFSAVFGIFETGDFSVSIPVTGQLRQVVIRTRMNEYPVWSAEEGAIPQSERSGVYVELERDDVRAISMTYEGVSMGVTRVEPAAAESLIFLPNDIRMHSRAAEGPVPFSVMARAADGTAVAYGSFRFDLEQEKMYLTVTADGRIREEDHERL